jgi:hypothetical protein
VDVAPDSGFGALLCFGKVFAIGSIGSDVTVSFSTGKVEAQYKNIPEGLNSDVRPIGWDGSSDHGNGLYLLQLYSLGNLSLNTLLCCASMAASPIKFEATVHIAAFEPLVLGSVHRANYLCVLPGLLSSIRLNAAVPLPNLDMETASRIGRGGALPTCDACSAASVIPPWPGR